MDDKSFYYIVGRESCPWCVKAKERLQQFGIPCVFRDLEDNQQLMEQYTEKYNWNTVPMIFHFDTSTGKHQFVGGYTDMVEHVDSLEGE